MPDEKRRLDGDGNSYVMVMRSWIIVCMFGEETLEGVRGANGKGKGEEHVLRRWCVRPSWMSITWSSMFRRFSRCGGTTSVL